MAGKGDRWPHQTVWSAGHIEVEREYTHMEDRVDPLRQRNVAKIAHGVETTDIRTCVMAVKIARAVTSVLAAAVFPTRTKI